ncbi:MAG: ribbon-helix-helix protein, CopG family [Egibacteraceae bacterium]
MRTTIELPDGHYRALRTLAARRGIRGFSPLIREAVDLLLAREDEAEIDEALALAGVLDDADADALEDHVRGVRARPRRSLSDSGARRDT